MTTQRNPAHTDEEPDTAKAQAAAPGSRQPVPETEHSEQGAWNGYVVPSGEHPATGRGSSAGEAWPHSRPVGPPADSHPALRRVVERRSSEGHAAATAATTETAGPDPEVVTDTATAVDTENTGRQKGREADTAEQAEAAGETHGAAKPARGSHRRHAAPAQTAADGADPDDPDRLADWVGSLAEDDGRTMIAARRTVFEPADGPAATTRENEEYRPTTREFWQPMPETTREELIARLDSLATIVSIGRDDFDPEVIERARHVLNHAGARLRLSGEHTVVALAGGTGSGKSSLFNALCGLDFSRVGITRPTTSAAHACVWGNEGADNLLEWLGVPRRNRHSRTSELDKDGSELSGLILLDLPDHDSVQALHTSEADRLIGSVDLLVWVLDPQKYADAAVHHRYLAEMPGYEAVTVAVLNQVDRVEPEELEELLTDLRRLLETESGVQTHVLTTSTVTGQGVSGLRELLIETVGERRALIDRLVADLDSVVDGFERYHGADDVEPRVPDDVRQRLVDDLLEAGGAPAIADTAETAHEQRGSRRVGWPVARWVRKLRRDPLRVARMDFLRDSGDKTSIGPIEAQEAEIERIAAEVADRTAGSLPSPWPRRVRAAARTSTPDLPGELGNVIAGTVPNPEDTPSWWQTVRIVQYLLVAFTGVGLAWLGTLAVSWLGGGLTGIGMFDDPVLIGFAAAIVVATPAVGWLTDVGCRNLVSVAAAQRREQVELKSTERVRAMAEERIIVPVEQELQRYREFSRALAAAQARDA